MRQLEETKGTKTAAMMMAITIMGVMMTTKMVVMKMMMGPHLPQNLPMST